ncbi:MAG: 5-(carboxyamino)imidazole ribonucleotide mutase [[Eubacterium] brachy]|jgi:N5-carboxyaminoimidazole ribonucleotide mutase|nr:phosphoribosylaminoimidazole carboxylase, catalytic subunit [Eubacterium brachy ATCC 33089]MBF1134665.1 5-(carboxyamino)imidazole ribonucleotide mutase [[Eubacterium] brachy]
MKVGVIMGSQSDWQVVKKAVKVLKDFNVEVEARVISAHRTPRIAEEFAKNAEVNGFDVIIAAAGKAAHLAGVMAGNTHLPIIGVPMKTGDLGGMDSLLSTVQMPSGVPVATVAVGGAENAALLSIQMLGIKYPELKEKIKEYRRRQEKEVIEADQTLEY